MTETNKEIVRKFVEGIWNYEKLASLNQILAPDYVFHDAVGDTHGIDEYRQEVAEEMEAFSDILVAIEDIVAEGDRVAVRYKTSYLHHGEFMHAYPTGKLAIVRGIGLHRVAGGRIAETWEAYDRRMFARDVGAEQRLGEEDELAIRKVVDEALKIGFANRPALAQHYWSDSAEIVAANGEVMRGRRAITEWLQRFPPVIEWRLCDLNIDGAGEWACVRGRYSMELGPRAKMPYDKGQYMEIWRKQADDTWKVARHVYTSELASRTRHRNAETVHA